MAWTDMCQIQFQQIVTTRKLQGQKVKQILEQNAEETGIPYETLKRWYYHKESKKSVKNDTHDSSPGSDEGSPENQEPRKHRATGKKPTGGSRKGAGAKPKAAQNEKLLDKINDLLTELEGRDISGIDASRLTQFVVRVQQLLKSKVKEK